MLIYSGIVPENLDFNPTGKTDDKLRHASISGKNTENFQETKMKIVDNEGHVIPPYFFPHRINATIYIEMLDMVVKLYIKRVTIDVATGLFPQDRWLRIFMIMSPP